MRKQGQIVPRGDGKHLVRVYLGRVNGRKKYASKVVTGSPTDAKRVLARMLTAADDGKLRARTPVTLGEYLTQWLATTVAPGCRRRTLHDYTTTADRYVRPHLGQKKLQKITPADVRALVATLVDQGLSPRTVRKAHGVLRNALNQAVADGLLAANPAVGRAVAKALPSKRKKVVPETVEPEKLADFLTAAREDRFHAYWLVLLFGGLRPGEALALRWSDVQGDTVRVRRTLVDVGGVDLHFAPPKTERSRRAIVLPQIAVEALAAHRRQQAEERLAVGPAWEDNDLVFCDEFGRPLRQDRTRASFAAILAAAKLPAMRIYDLRHSAATLLLVAGEDLKVVSERLGHSTITLTADTYSHVTRGLQERAASKLDALVANS